jgi:hypothetical protein
MKVLHHEKHEKQAPQINVYFLAKTCKQKNRRLDDDDDYEEEEDNDDTNCVKKAPLPGILQVTLKKIDRLYYTGLVYEK